MNGSIKRGKVVGRLWAVLACAICAMGLGACHSEHCKEKMYTYAKVSFFHYQNPKNAITLEGVKVSNLDERGNEVSQLITEGNYASLDLTLNPNADTSRFKIQSNFLNETLVIVHDNTPEYVSAECGCRVKSYINDVYLDKSECRDSFSIENANVDEMYDNENIRLYLFIE